MCALRWRTCFSATALARCRLPLPFHSEGLAFCTATCARCRASPSLAVQADGDHPPSLAVAEGEQWELVPPPGQGAAAAVNAVRRGQEEGQGGGGGHLDLQFELLVDLMVDVYTTEVRNLYTAGVLAKVRNRASDKAELAKCVELIKRAKTVADGRRRQQRFERGDDGARQVQRSGCESCKNLPCPAVSVNFPRKILCARPGPGLDS